MRFDGWKLGYNKVWWLRGIYSPNHQYGRWWGLLSYGAPDSPVRHRTLSGAPATSPSCWVLTVGALTCGATGQSSGALVTGQSLFTVRCAFCDCSDFYARSCALLITVHLLQTTVGAVSRYSTWHTGQSGATPDSPVLHRTVRWIIAEWLPIFPKLASWRESTLVHRTLSGGTPDSPVRQTRAAFGCLLLFLFEPFLGLFIGLCWTFGTCRTYNLEQTS
jgi:hypothetical protein